MMLVKLSKPAFFKWVKKHGIEFITIGQISLFRKNVIVAKLLSK